ncbi:MAG: TIM-barrel domain-containing protein, partial [Deltaproteobacteria bacterium]
VSYDLPGRFFARPEDAPVAWMGDNRRDWFGLADALDEMFRSSRAGYVVVGSDIGGYLDLDDQNLAGPVIPFSQTVFARWTAVGALSPFMQLHGRANLTPWTVSERPDETVVLYRYWSTLHHELVPFFASLAEQGFASGPPFTPIVHPVGDPASWAGDYRYLLGDAFLVAPVLDDSGVRDVPLPGGARWYDWWSPASDAIPGGTTLTHFDSSDRAHVPLFVRDGAIVPVEVSSPLTGLGVTTAQGALTVLVYPAVAGSDFTVSEADGAHTQIHTTRDATGGIVVDLTPVHRRTVLRVRADLPVTAATRDGTTMSPAPNRVGFDAGVSDFFYDPILRVAWVRIAAPSGPPGATTRIALRPSP